MRINDLKIGVIGLGYVGLPIALEFGKNFKTYGFDINAKRIESLNKHKDSNSEVKIKDFKKSKNVNFTSNIKNLSICNFFIITVPTPLKNNKLPDLSLLKDASEKVGKLLKPNDMVIYESTVYPGVTEEICVPILKKNSKLNYINSKKNIKNGFYCGYSPERINPGDKKNNLTNIVKVVSGSNIKAAKFIKKVYSTIINKEIYLASSIKVAEAAKVIENTQRDLNIALANEFLMIFKKMNINFVEVLRAASTKWNFLNFKPGLVGGHCIGIDPFYLTYVAKKKGYNPKLILAGRKINDNMSIFYVQKCLEKMQEIEIKIKNIKVLILGATFKEDISDCRNSKVFDMIEYFARLNIQTDVYDPHIISQDIPVKLRKNFIKNLTFKKYNCIILAVSHKFFLTKNFQLKILRSSRKNFFIFDLKSKLNKKVFKNNYVNF